MSLPDHLMSKYFELLTDFTHQEIWEFSTCIHEMQTQTCGRDNNHVHNSQDAETAKEEFLRMFSEKVFPMKFLKNASFWEPLLFLKWLLRLEFVLPMEKPVGLLLKEG